MKFLNEADSSESSLNNLISPAHHYGIEPRRFSKKSTLFSNKLNKIYKTQLKYADNELLILSLLLLIIILLVFPIIILLLSIIISTTY